MQPIKPIQYDDLIIGEPEIVFQVDARNFVRLYIGTFNTLMDYGLPGEDGLWQGIVLNYHLVDAFYDEPEWVVPEPEVYLQSLKAINVAPDNPATQTVQSKLIRLFEYALQQDLKVTINYF